MYAINSFIIHLLNFNQIRRNLNTLCYIYKTNLSIVYSLSEELCIYKLTCGLSSGSGRGGLEARM